MRLFELTTSPLFLCTTEAEKEGAILSCSSTMQLLAAEIEAVLEAKRPDDRCPRQTSIFLSETPRASPFVYQVEPLGGVDRNHTGWLKLLQEVDPLQSGVMQAHAIGYWSGKECPQARQEPWEVRALRVKVLRRVGASGKDHTVIPSIG